MDFITPEIVSEGLSIFASLGIAIIVSIVVAAIAAGVVMLVVIKAIRALAGFGGVHADDIGYNERIEDEREAAEQSTEQKEAAGQKELVG